MQECLHGIECIGLIYVPIRICMWHQGGTSQNSYINGWFDVEGMSETWNGYDGLISERCRWTVPFSWSLFRSVSDWRSSREDEQSEEEIGEDNCAHRPTRWFVFCSVPSESVFQSVSDCHLPLKTRKFLRDHVLLQPQILKGGELTETKTEREVDKVARQREG